MALKVWLPLNGNLKNQGLDGSVSALTATSPIYTDGKIGKCLNANAYATNTPTFNSLNGLSVYSFCCWLKIITSETASDNYARILSLGSNHDGNTNGIRIEHIPTAGCCQVIFNKSESYGSSVNYYGISLGSSAVAKDQWVHITVTNDGTNVRCYCNGSLVSTNNISNIYQSGHLTGTLYLGHSSGHCYLNDVRIYDNCLSPKEVSEIAKGLVLHYPLNNGGFGAPNLVKNSLINTTSSTYGFETRDVTVESGKQYVFSVNGRISDAAKNDGTTLKVYLYKSDWSYCPLILSISSTTDTTVTGTFTANQSTTLKITSYSFLSQSTAGSPVTTNWYKLEEGSKATTWSPNTADALYPTTEADCSGFNNNGTRSGTLTYSADSPRYSGSLEFYGSQYIAAGKTAKVTDAITVSWWGYMDDWSAYTRAISCTETGGWNFEPNNSKMSFPLYRNSTYITITDTVNLSSYSAGWHNFVATYDGYKSCLYTDGALKATSSATTTKYPITYNSANGIFIGAEAGVSSTDPYNNYFSGKLSDIRIYATALSAEDIKELYNTPISIDNQGNMYGYEFVENDLNNFSSKGVITNSEFIDLDSTGDTHTKAAVSATTDYATMFIEK